RHSQKNSTTSVAVARDWPKAIQPCPRSVNSSRRSTISLSPSTVMKVPFALWSVRMNLSRRRSILPCAREAMRSLTTRSAEAARRDIHRVAEHVAVALDHRTMIEADAHADLRVAHRRHLRDCALDLDRRIGGLVRGGEGGHHLVADRLDDPALGVDGLLAHQIH